jgi:hypothetical protein
MSTDNVSTKVITGTVRLSYAKVHKAESMEEGGEKRYSTAILIPKSDKKTVGEIKKAVAAALEAGAKVFGGKIPAKPKLPLRDGDEEKPDDENYAGHWFLSASSKTKPQFLNRSKEAIPAEDAEDEIYSGVYARVSLNFYAFNTKGNKGIAAGLNNILKVKDGPALSGRSSAAEDFADVELEDEDDNLDTDENEFG